jgi:hypothetical protein
MQINLHKNQLKLLKSLPNADVNFMRCGRRFGKSFLAVRYMLLRSVSPGVPSLIHTPQDEMPLNLIIMPSVPMLERVFWRPLLKLVESTEWGDLVDDLNKTHKLLTFKTEPSVNLQLLSLGADAKGDNIRGTKIFTAWVDEGQDVNLEYLIDEVLKPACETKGSQINVTFTPKGKASYLASRTEKLHFNEKSYHFTSWDNPKLNREKLETLRLTLPEKKYAQEILAEFVAPEAQVFSSLSAKHLITQEALPQKLYYYISIDPGVSNFALSCWAMSADYKFYVIDSFYSAGETTTVDEAVGKIFAFAEKYEVIQSIYFPDDRVDYIVSFNKLLRDTIKTTKTKLNTTTYSTANFKIAKGVKKVSRQKINPSVRYDWMNTLLAKDALFFVDEAAYNEFGSMYRKKCPKTGLILEEIPKQQDHIIDSTGYGICSLINSNKSLLNLHIKLDKIIDERET